MGIGKEADKCGGADEVEEPEECEQTEEVLYNGNNPINL